MAHVRGDPVIGGHFVLRKVGCKLGEGYDVRSTAGVVRADIIIVEKWVMLLHIETIRRIANIAGGRHTLHIGLPGTTTCLYLICEIGSILKAGGAIAGNTEGASSCQGHVVWKARMSNGIVLCCKTVGTY